MLIYLRYSRWMVNFSIGFFYFSVILGFHQTNNLEIRLFACFYIHLEVITIRVFMVSYYYECYYCLLRCTRILLISMSYTIKYLINSQILVDEFIKGFFLFYWPSNQFYCFLFNSINCLDKTSFGGWVNSGTVNGLLRK